MLSVNQMSNLDEAAREIQDKKLILDLAVDVQSILQILVEKGITTKEEVEQKRAMVRNAPKYKNGYTYIQQTMEEIIKYKKDPQALLREMMRRKMEE